MLSLSISVYTVLGYISLLFVVLGLSFYTTNSVEQDSLRSHTDLKKIWASVLTLLGASHSLAGDSPWYALAGVMYLFIVMLILPIIVDYSKTNSVASYIEKYYGSKARRLLSVVCLLYLSLRLSMYANAVHHHLETFLVNEYYLLLFSLCIIASLALLFYLGGTVWLQGLLMLLCMAIVPWLVRRYIHLVGGIQAWSIWGSHMKVVLQDPWQDMINYILPCHLLIGDFFFCKNRKSSRHLQRILMISIGLALACKLLWSFVHALGLGFVENYGALYDVGVVSWYLFVIVQMFYIGGRLLCYGVIGMRESTINDLSQAKTAGLVVFVWGIITTTSSYYISSTMLTLIASHLLCFVIPLQVILLGGIIGLVPDQKIFYSTLSISSLVYGIGLEIGLVSNTSILLATLASIATFIMAHYSLHKGFSFVKVNWQYQQSCERYKYAWQRTMVYLKKFILLPKYLASLSRESVSFYGHQPLKFGLAFCTISYILPFFITSFYSQATYQTLTTIQYIGCGLSIALILYPYWPKSLLRYLALYWHLTLCYCLSLSPSLSYLLVEGSPPWLINIAVSNMLLARLVGSVSFVLLQTCGVSASWLIGSYLLINQQNVVSIFYNNGNFYPLIYTYALSSIVGIIFMSKSDSEVKHTYQVVKSFCRNIMHKFTNVLGLAKSHATLLTFCSKSMETISQKSDDTVLIKIGKVPYEVMNESIDLLKKENSLSQHTLKNISMAIRANVKPIEFQYHSLSNCIKDGLTNYNLHYESFKTLRINIKDDFMFWGSDNHFAQVIFNLLENTYVHNSQGCEVSINLQGHSLYYQDNGSGIPSIHLPYIFDEFYTTNQSLGMGLAYVKKVIQTFGGNVVCNSSTKQGSSYTRFIITLTKFSIHDEA